MNIFELYNGAKSLGGNRNYTLYEADNVINAVNVDTKEKVVIFEVLTRGSKPKEVYTSYLQFEITLLSEAPKGQKYFNIVQDGVEYFIPVIPKKADLKLRCTCQDYYWTFQHWNYIKGINLGNDIEPYEPKGTRPPRNPDHYNGMCKHLYQAFVLLQKNGYIET